MITFPGPYGNIAFNKTTFHSTTLFNDDLQFGSYKAVDGSRYNRQNNVECFLSSWTDQSPWMIVDLQRSYTIMGVAILAREEECCRKYF